MLDGIDAWSNRLFTVSALFWNFDNFLASVIVTFVYRLIMARSLHNVTSGQVAYLGMMPYKQCHHPSAPKEPLVALL